MNKEERICIIGAGVSGLSFAHFLEEKGYKNVTVLEKEDRVGGKCYTIEYKGKTYELGAMMSVRSTPNVVEFMNKFGANKIGPVLHRGFFNKNGKQIPQIDINEAKEFRKQFFKLSKILEDYKDIWKPGFKNTPLSLTIPFSQWCNKNEIPLIKKIYEPPFNGFGYGYLDETSTIYVLKYLDFKILKYFVEIDHLITWVDGSQRLWEKVASSLNDIKLGVNILEIKRDDKVRVRTDIEELEFDKLVLACPLDDSLEFLDGTEEEIELFSKIKYNDYYVLAYKIESIPRFCGYLPYNFSRDRTGHLLVWYYRWQDMAKNDLVTVYALGDENTTPREVKKKVNEDLKKVGAEIEGLYTYKKWRHFPHVDGEEIRKGYYDKIENLQSVNNTYYIGELMSFALIEDCIVYSRNMAEKYF